MKQIITHVFEVDRSDIALLPPGTQVLYLNRLTGVYKLTKAGRIKHIHRKTAYFIFELPEANHETQRETGNGNLQPD